jgi:hypothetical protein
MARAKHGGKRRNKVQFKWTKELIFFLIGFVVLIGIMIYCLIPTAKQSFYNTWYTSSNNLLLDNQFEDASYDKLKKKIDNKERVYVFYGYDGDDTSKTDLGILDHYTNKYVGTNADTHYDIDKIYVYNAKEAATLNSDDEKAVAKFDEKVDYFNSIKSSDINKDINLKTYCQLWIFDNGQLVFSSADIINDSQGSSQGANFTLAAIKGLGYFLTEKDVK